MAGGAGCEGGGRNSSSPCTARLYTRSNARARTAVLSSPRILRAPKQNHGQLEKVLCLWRCAAGFAHPARQQICAISMLCRARRAEHLFAQR